MLQCVRVLQFPKPLAPKMLSTDIFNAALLVLLVSWGFSSCKMTVNNSDCESDRLRNKLMCISLSRSAKPWLHTLVPFSLLSSLLSHFHHAPSYHSSSYSHPPYELLTALTQAVMQSFIIGTFFLFFFFAKQFQTIELSFFLFQKTWVCSVCTDKLFISSLCSLS